VKKLRVTRYVGGKTYYVTVQCAGEQPPHLRESNLPKGQMRDKQVSRPHSAPVKELYKPVLTQVQIPPEFATQKEERLVRTPRWFAKQKAKLIAKQSRENRVKAKDEVKKVQKANDKQTFKAGFVPQPKPMPKKESSKSLAWSWWKDITDAGGYSLGHVPVYLSCEQLNFRFIETKSGNRVVQAEKSRLGQERLNLFLKLDKVALQKGVEWSQLCDTKVGCLCKECRVA